MPKDGDEEASPLQPKPKSTNSPLPTIFSSPMRHTPGQRIHTVEGPGRLSRMGSTPGSEKQINTGDPAPFRRRKPSSSLMGLDLISQSSALKGSTSEDDEIVPAVDEGHDAPHDASNGGTSSSLPYRKTLPHPEEANGELAESSVASQARRSSWDVARAHALNLNTSAAAPPGSELQRYSTMYDVVGAAIEARRQEWREHQQTTQFFESTVVSSVMRQRRLHKSRRTRVLLLLDEPSSSRIAMAVFSAMLALVFVSVALVVIGTMDPSDKVKEVLWGIELGCSVVFCMELLLRLAAADSVCSVVSDVYLWIDFVSIVPFVVDLIYFAAHGGESGDDDSLLDALRLARLLRLLKLARHYEGTRVLIDALRDSVSALMAPLFFLFVSVVLFSGALYHVERGGPAEDDFDNILKCAWFMLVTFSTVGYGDRSPGTPTGKAVTCVAIVGGVLFMAMPITIVGSSFARVWDQKETKDVVRKMQELLLERGLRATDVLTVFHEFDTTNDGEIDLQEFKGALEVLGLRLRPHQVRKLFDAFDKDHNNTVDFVEFCHVIFPDLDEEKLLEEYAARIKDTPRTRARSAYVMSMLTGNSAPGGGAPAAAAEAPLASLAEESSIGIRSELSLQSKSKSPCCFGTPGQTRGRMMACRMSAMDENVRLGRPATDACVGTAAAPSAASATDPSAASAPPFGGLLRGNSSSKLPRVPASPAERKMYQKKKKKSRRSSAPLPSLPPVVAQDEPAELQLTARVYAAALSERRGGGPDSHAGGGSGGGSGGGGGGGGGGGSGGGGGGGGATTAAANASWLGDDRGAEALELLRHALKRMDDLETEIHKQAARGARDRKAVQEALEIHGQAINAVASRLGATTSQAVVRAFKSSENLTGALKSHGSDGVSAGSEKPCQSQQRGPSLAEARRAARGSMGSSVFSSKAPLGSHEA